MSNYANYKSNQMKLTKQDCRFIETFGTVKEKKNEQHFHFCFLEKANKLVNMTRPRGYKTFLRSTQLSMKYPAHKC